MFYLLNILINKKYMCYLHELAFIFLITQIAMFSYGEGENSSGKSSSHFAIDLFTNLPSEENIIFSPLSIQLCIALAGVGATGHTRDEISKAIGVSYNSQGISESFRKVLDVLDTNKLVRIANKVYIKKGYQIQSKFMEIVTKQFHSDAEDIDFNQNIKSANLMNNWIAVQTNHKIKKLISAENLDKDTRIVLLSAIHFKGEWAMKFNANRTKEDNFYLDDSKTVKVQMMKTKGKFRFGRFGDLDATVLEMPYQSSDLSMLILLPNKKTDLSQLRTNLKNKTLEDIVSNMLEAEVLVKMPKFRSEYLIDLQEPLRKLGIERMFTNKAEFGNILEESVELKVSKVVHKAFIEVNEDGVEATAATAGIVRNKRSLDIIENIDFIANHPFIYVITSKNNAACHRVMLFLGSINKLEEIASQTTHDEF